MDDKAAASRLHSQRLFFLASIQRMGKSAFSTCRDIVVTILNMISIRNQLEMSFVKPRSKGK